MIQENPYIISAISHRSDGSMMKNKAIQELNARAFLHAQDIPYETTHFMRQVHGSKIAYVDDYTPQIVNSVDGLITDKTGIFLSVVTADCVPITLYDQTSNIVGVAHAGYRGILSGVVNNLVSTARDLGSENHTMQFIIGASIGSCCYDIPEDRADAFFNTFKSEDIFRYHGDKIFLNLSEVVNVILKDEHIPKENIMLNGVCTKCNNDLYFSYRGDSSDTFGQFMTVVGMKEGYI